MPPASPSTCTGRAPKTATAKPRGRTALSSRDEAALSERGMHVRSAYPGDPLHHVFPQEREIQEWLA